MGGANQRGSAGNLDENAKNVSNQCDDVGNQGRNLSIAVEMTQNGNGNEAFKERRVVKIIKNEQICKNLVSHIGSAVFPVNLGKTFLGKFRAISFWLYYFLTDFEHVNTGWEG